MNKYVRSHTLISLFCNGIVLTQNFRETEEMLIWKDEKFAMCASVSRRYLKFTISKKVLNCAEW
jgi:hypothetical protein